MQYDLATVSVFFDPLALLLVLFGAFLLAASQDGLSITIRAFAALPIIFRSNPEKDEKNAFAVSKRVERIVEKRGISCADRVKVHDAFIRELLFEMSNRNNVASISQWARRDIDHRAKRHSQASRFWITVAELAPALGMIGTVIGLVLMFGHVEDAAGIGQAMATAMLTTLYGLMLSNIFAAPIATRLSRSSEAEIAWKLELADALINLADQEYLKPSLVRQPSDDMLELPKCA